MRFGQASRTLSTSIATPSSWCPPVIRSAAARISGGVAHGHTETGSLQHGDVVNVIADGADCRWFNSPEPRQMQDRSPFPGVVPEDFTHSAAVSRNALNEGLDPACDLVVRGLLKSEHLGSRSDRADMKNRVTGMLRWSVISAICHRRLPLRVDLGMFAVLADVVVETIDASWIRGDDEIGEVETTVGEDNSRLAQATEQFENLG